MDYSFISEFLQFTGLYYKRCVWCYRIIPKTEENKSQYQGVRFCDKKCKKEQEEFHEFRQLKRQKISDKAKYLRKKLQS